MDEDVMEMNRQTALLVAELPTVDGAYPVYNSYSERATSLYELWDEGRSSSNSGPRETRIYLAWNQNALQSSLQRLVYWTSQSRHSLWIRSSCTVNSVAPYWSEWIAAILSEVGRN
ncbi:hypothetical protein J6590_037674 [Homalodisca vitripennis]|nr:hypothetical protein J6590_037674 [Homalodisca vitripennis]